jgi:hypothetical protein
MRSRVLQGLLPARCRMAVVAVRAIAAGAGALIRRPALRRTDPTMRLAVIALAVGHCVVRAIF